MSEHRSSELSARAIVEACRDLYTRLADGPEPELEKRIDEMVWAAFGLPVEEV